MKLYKTIKGIFLQHDQLVYQLNQQWDELVNRDDLYGFLTTAAQSANKVSGDDWQTDLLPPIQNQEIWAAGVTYLQSRDARVEESQSSGGSDLYKRVYDAERPEIFFKSTAARAVGHGQDIAIRKDSTWNVPEPELTLFINSNGDIQGYTVGNDMSSRSIEGENALYLPQAKTYDRSAAIGPCLAVLAEPISKETIISITIKRNEVVVYSDNTPLSRMKRQLTELAGFLFRELTFPYGAYLMTGTCLVPPNDFTLAPGDVVEITIDGIGTLTNTVAHN